MEALCKCGCGMITNQGKFFISGHNARMMSDETKKKMSESRKGKRHHFYGKSLSEDHIKKLSESHLGQRAWNKNVQVPKEMKERISKTLKAYYASGNDPWMKGKKHSVISRKKISDSGIGRPSPMKGKNFPKEFGEIVSKRNLKRCNTLENKKIFSDRMRNYFLNGENRIKASCIQQGISREEWTGFVSQEPYCDIWNKEYKDFIKERDYYKCQNIGLCSNSNSNSNNNCLCVHHIDYVKKNCQPNNLITLCNSCHSRANYNRPFWQERYSKILKSNRR